MSDFHMKRAYNKGEKPKIANKVSNIEDHMENKVYNDFPFILKEKHNYLNCYCKLIKLSS